MNRTNGFTLIEIAIVLVIVGLLLGGLLMPLATQMELQKREETEKAMEEIKEAIIGFALINGRLPCPDVDVPRDGVADVAPPSPFQPNVPATGQSTQTTACSAPILAGVQIGGLPYATLGSASMDSWGNRFDYIVNSAFTTQTVVFAGLGGTLPVLSDAGFTLATAGTLDVQTRNPATKVAADIAGDVPVVMVSHGKNGLGATSNIGVAQGPVVANTDEANNADGVSPFISRSTTVERSPCSDTVAGQPFCEFDDVIGWVSTTVLFNRMVSAGQLP